MPDALPPFAIYLIGALLVPLLRGRARQAFALLIPVIGFVNFFNIVEGVHWTVPLLDFELILGRADAWSLIFLNIFTVLSFVGILYIIRENVALDLSAGLLYAGSAMGVVMAGDLLTLFFFWEMLTLGAVLCLLARRTEASGKAAYRYLLLHVLGGGVLLAGVVIHLGSGGSLAFDKIELAGPGPILMFLGFGINCAWPLVGAWLTDTYPEASIGGVVFMATFTTKTAVYVLARTFPGEEPLMWIGMAMATIPIFYAVIENDLRRVLAYSLINQVGFMIVGVGLGTPLSLNGTAAHAYCHILYKALLFMSIGSVIYRTGKSKATELGGLYRSMPWTCIFCCIGAASISAFPLFSGFVSKSMIMSSAAKEGQVIIWLALLFASAGVFHHAGIKIPFFAFFSHDSGLRCKEAPANQLAAMGIVAFLCIFVGTFPNVFLYPMLPNVEASYAPYTVAHVTDQLALLLFSALAFTLLMRAGLYPAEIRSTNVDADWLYRRGGSVIYRVMDRLLNGLNALTKRLVVDKLVGALAQFFRNAPAHLLIGFAIPVWKTQGFTAAEIEEKRTAFFERSRLGAFPIGITAAIAVVMLGLLYVL
ncbi:MAG: Na(+)/H(+) antiporter subunit D [Verrucomicrobiota bacterium]